jgi:DeoR family transcriptional regulator of aga operon
VKLFTEERRRRIRQLIHERERVTVEELAQRFDVSTVTVRSDLAALEAAGVLVRSHGGAIKPVDLATDVPIGVKEGLHRAEKARIARVAARMIQPGETVVLDSGTTTHAIARELRREPTVPLTVITNALNIAVELAGVPRIRVIQLGGLVRDMSLSTVGPQAEQMLHGLRADRAFLGVDGLDAEAGLTTPDVLEAKLNALMIQVSREIVAVADASKLGRRSLCTIAPLDALDKLVTDARPPQAMRRTLREADVEVVLA